MMMMMMKSVEGKDKVHLRTGHEGSGGVEV
jgi:hypothetical protein